VSYNGAQLFELPKKVGRSWRTLQYWAAQGCDLNDPQSLQRFLTEKNRKRSNVQKFREYRGLAQSLSPRLLIAGILTHLNRTAMVRQRLRVGAVRNMLCCAWNKKEEESFRRLKTACCRVEINSRLTHARPSG
jgi:hypothetical protein